MKSVITKNFKGMLLTMGLGLLSTVGFSQEHMTLSVQNITSTATTIEYDLYVINDGSTALKLAACAIGMNYNPVILNGATSVESAQTAMPASRAQSLGGLSPFSLLNTTRMEANQLRMTMKPVRVDVAPVLLANVPYKVGRFKFTNSKPWASNSNPSFVLNENNIPGLSTSCANAYVNNAPVSTGFSVAKKNLKVQIIGSVLLNASNTVDATLNGSVKMATTEDNSAESTRQGLGMGEENKISVYPNPTTDMLNVDFYASSLVNTVVKISDMRGRIVKQIQARSEKGMNNMTISLHEITSGVYNIQVFQDNKLMMTDKVTKQD